MKRQSGALRLIGGAFGHGCHRGEIRVTWAVRGPQGDPGPATAATAYSQMTAHGYTGLLKGSGPLTLATLPGVGTLSLFCEANGNADYQYVSSGAGEQTVAFDNAGTITRAYLIPSGGSVTKSVPGVSPDVRLTFMVTGQPGQPSGEFDLMTDHVGGDCHEQMTTLLIPTTTP